MHHSVRVYFHILLATMVCHERSDFNMTSKQLIVSACSLSFQQSLRSALSSLTSSIPEPRKCPRSSHTIQQQITQPAPSLASLAVPILHSWSAQLNYCVWSRVWKKARRKENSMLWCLAGGLWCLANRESCEPQRPANNFSTGSGLLTWAPGAGHSLMFSPTWL